MQFSHKKGSLPMILPTTAVTGIVFSGASTCYLWRRTRDEENGKNRWKSCHILWIQAIQVPKGVVWLSLLLSCICASASNIITPTTPIRDGESIISPQNQFQLLFLSPTQSQSRFLAIRYYRAGTEKNSIWVWGANLEKPLADTNGSFGIQKDGNLAVLDGTQQVIWSTNISTTANSTIAELLDTGNLILRDASYGIASGSILWQSFDHPSDLILPAMKIGFNRRTGQNWMLRSWKNYSDPSAGSFSFGIDTQELKQFFIWRGTVPYWRSFFWNGTAFNSMHVGKNLNYTIVSNEDEAYFTYKPSVNNTIYSFLVLRPDGTLVELQGFPGGGVVRSNDSWLSGTVDVCSTLRNDCGVGTSCNNDDTPPCKCLPGFVPTSPNDWNSGDWSAGCTRKTPLQCGNNDQYSTFKRVKLAPPAQSYDGSQSEAECLQLLTFVGCFNAYAFARVSRDGVNGSCHIWYDKDLTHFREDDDVDDGLEWNLNLRLASSDLKLQGRQCRNCGTNTIPYPLSTGVDCGDPIYSSIQCDNTTGQLRFLAADGSSYEITSFKPDIRTLVIKPAGVDLCWANSSRRTDIHLNTSQAFFMTNSNTVILLNCSTPQNTSILGCNSSSLCRKYIQGGRAPCFDPEKCCSYVAGGSLSSSETIGILGTGCSAYASVVDLNSSADVGSWREGIEIGWHVPREPMCSSEVDCDAWPNSRCLNDTAKVGTKRCFCIGNFHWDGSIMNCVIDGGANRKRRFLLITIIPVVVGILLLGTMVYYLRKKKGRRNGNRKNDLNVLMNGLDTSGTTANGLLDGNIFRQNGNNGIDVPFVDYKSILEATENFSESNKLGQGGFGAVYRGKISDGREIAVKKLSNCSEQSLEGFKNEVVLIGKLQHRNLVKLLGYSIEGDERILIYEYMPNKSLNFFLTGRDPSNVLDWENRFNIILGIARGLLYLHQDSRLRIIHRDFKTGNILLDEQMNPKIADFGMAKIFGGNQTPENTNRIVGTYGYMPPEYAARGHFSVKFDVYSFGVVLVEIVSGKMISKYYNYEQGLSLTGYAWHLWMEERPLELIDPSLNGMFNLSQVMKCINIGLLCVQEDAKDRPTMANVLAILESENPSLRTPNQPAFYVASAPAANSSGNGSIRSSRNELTMSILEGR